MKEYEREGDIDVDKFLADVHAEMTPKERAESDAWVKETAAGLRAALSQGDGDPGDLPDYEPLTPDTPMGDDGYYVWA